MLQIFSNFRNPDTDPLFNHLRKHYSEKPITIFYECFPSSDKELKINPYNFLIILEPNEFFGLHSTAIQSQYMFTGIISWSNDVWEMCDNAVPFTFNGRVLDDKFLESIKDKTKKFEVSFLCGDKKLSEGHILRHKVYGLESKISIPKNGIMSWVIMTHQPKLAPATQIIQKTYLTYPKELILLDMVKEFYMKNLCLMW